MRIILFALLALLSSCSCGNMSRGQMRIAVDPSWYPLGFDEMQPYVNGYVEDLLMDVSRYSGISFEKVSANWDSLLEGLQNGQYDAILSSLPPYPFHEAKYEFSQTFLELGPVLVVPADAKKTSLSDLSKAPVGIIVGDDTALVLEKYPQILIRTYPTIPAVLDAVVGGTIEAALLKRIPATGFVNDLYAGKLKIGSPPLTDTGIRAITLKGKAERFIQLCNESIDRMKKKKALDELQKKWNL